MKMRALIVLCLALPSHPALAVQHAHRVVAHKARPAQVAVPLPHESRDSLVALARTYYAARLPNRNCDLPEINLLHWEGFPVQSCTYAVGSVAVRTYMLNPTADQLARWTVTACADAHAVRPRDCIGYLARQVMASSGAVFPVAGYLPAMLEAGSGRGTIYCHLYRDGVAILTDSWKEARRPMGPNCGPQEELERPARFARATAHIAATTRDDYRRFGGMDAVGTDKDGNVHWIDVVRLQYQQAWGNERNTLLSARAKAAKGQHFQ